MKNNWTGERLETFVHNETTVEHLHRYAIALDIINNSDVLDIASGEGYGANLLADKANNVWGVDIDEISIKSAQKKYTKSNLKFLLGSATKIPLPENSIDVVVSFETIEHHDMHEEMFLEIKRVLRKDGKLLISSPEKLTETPYNKFHIKELTELEFKELVNKHFKNYTFFYQKILVGSIVVPSLGYKTSDTTEYDGDFTNLNSYPIMKNHVFNICVASDYQIPQINTSYYNGQNELYNSYTRPYRNSKLYLFSQFLKKIVNLK
jgi:ubiquinone/menaquinone biosynthesis C-methylase UbiE